MEKLIKTISFCRLSLIAVVLVMVVAVCSESVRACECRTQGYLDPCDIRGATLYPKIPPKSRSYCILPENDIPAPKFVYTGESEEDNTRRIELYWGKAAKKDGAKCNEPFIRCFTRPTAQSKNGIYNPTDQDLVNNKVTVNHVSDTNIKLLVNGVEIEQTNPHVKVIAKDGSVLLKATYDAPITASSEANSVEEGPYLYLRTLDGNNRITKLEVKLNGETIRTVYTRYTGDPVSRMRITEVTFNSNGDKRIRTTICGYYGNTGDNRAYRPHYVVQPDGVTRYLVPDHKGDGVDPDNPGNACGLDTVADATLDDYAAVLYNTYDADGCVLTMTAQGCGGCGGMGDGDYTFAYGTNGNYPAEPTDDQKYNTWKEYRRIILPSSLRKVEFTNMYGATVFDVTQEMNGETIVNRWITHYKYGSSGGNEGQMIEHRYPSACTVYSPTPANGWTTAPGETDTGTVGLVRLYSYDANDNLQWEKVRKGVTDNNNIEYYIRKYTYTSTTYDDMTVYRVATETSYPTRTTNADTADKLVTTYSYTYFQDEGSDTHAVETETITSLAVSTACNGSGEASVEVRHYKRIADPETGEYLYYWNDWTKSPGGSLSYTELNSDGQMVKTIQDVDTDETGDFSGLPAGWSNSGGQHLITLYTYDEDGRTETVTHPGGRKTVYAYTYQKETHGEGVNLRETTTALVTLVASHMDAGGKYDYVPLQITISKLNGDSISAAGIADTDEDGDLANDWDPTQTHINDAFDGTLTARTDSMVTTKGQMQQVRRYHNIPTGAGADGTLGNNYYLTYCRYDSTTNRKIRDIQIASGTDPTSTSENTGCVEQVAKYEYDQRGRVIETHVVVSPYSQAMGNDFSNEAGLTFKKVSASFYDESTPGSGTSGVGDGFVTSTIAYYDAANEANNVKAIYYYNYRGQLRGTRPEAVPYTVRDVDNMGRTTAAAQFISTANFGADWATVIADVDYAENASDSNRRTLSKSLYDQVGRTYRTEVYAVHQSGAGEGQAYDKIVTDSYYDAEGRLAGTASPGGGGTEFAYDSASRQIEARTIKALKYDKYEGGEYAYRDPQPGAATGGDDGVIQITRTTYDDSGSTIKTIAIEVNHDDTDGVNLAAGQEDYIRSASYAWHDVVGRSTGTAYYGSGDANDNWTHAPVPSRAADPPAASSAGCLVTRYAYNSAGRMETTTDPAGRVIKSVYDDLGRTIEVLENYVSGTPGDDENRRTLTQYNGLSNVVKQIADIDRDDTFSNGVWTTDADSQVTSYAFTDGYNASLATKITYPDSASSDWDVVTLAYHLDGAINTRTSQKAQAGDTRNVITFQYDAAFHRLEKQKVTTPGTGVDQTVLAIKTTFDDLGRVLKVTSYDNATNEAAGNAVNQVEYAFNDLGALEKEYQEHDGEKDGNTLFVQYNYYCQTTVGVYNKGMRVKSVQYPSERLVHYRYGVEGSRDEMISRLATIHDDDATTPGLPGQTLTSYSYNGAGRIVAEHFPQPNVKLDYFGDTTGTYAGFDRFGRVRDQRWRYLGGTPADRDRCAYGHDYNSNRLWRQNELTHGSANKFDEFYTYDGLDRLTDADRGTLDDPPADGLLSKNYQQAWTLDRVGNWDQFKWDPDGDGGSGWTTQDRTHNLVNEVQTIDVWVNPSHDARGNMKSSPQPGSETSQLDFTYDAWNRLVKVADNATSDVLGEYRYDGLNRRIRKYTDEPETGHNWTVREFYYNASWQVLEVRKQVKSRELGEPEPAATLYEQHVWSARYIDAPVQRDRDADGNPATGDLGKAGSGLEERLYYTTDANMNVTALVDTSGTVQERYVYDPYGKVAIYNSDWSATVIWANSKKNEILYCGYRHDDETKLYHVRNRMHHPTLGRWLQRDPIGYVDGMSLYEYGGSNPVVFIDPEGTVVVIVTGLGENKSKGGSLAKDIKRELIQAIKDAGLDSGDPTVGVKLEGGGGFGPQGALAGHYKDFVERKDKNPCSLEQFAAVGHSDGAAAIFNLLKSGKFNGNSKTGLWTPAVLVTVDLVRISYFDIFGNRDANKTETIVKPASCAIGNFRQTIGKPFGWKGRILQGASINVDVNRDAHIPGLNIANPLLGEDLDHFQTFYDPAARKLYARVVAKAYVWKVKEEKQAKLLERGRFGVPKGENLGKKDAPW